jgi:hypothetical protein
MAEEAQLAWVPFRSNFERMAQCEVLIVVMLLNRIFAARHFLVRRARPSKKVTAGLMIRTSRWAQKTAYFGFAHGESE